MYINRLLEELIRRTKIFGIHFIYEDNFNMLIILARKTKTEELYNNATKPYW